ncbi:hypothetical protein PGTUg99_003914 [Puccinia graminis f. sp. tritici]|uniref:Uncharacterized protein n=1 Tax=Puccinia graminis f. sp. tritici TaxID=56615 RepID=A0A5B0PAV1_PUCGR|nr:hypothetical protein PGTUg99_003914 [Puccinia graminis f. sp. tritici]
MWVVSDRHSPGRPPRVRTAHCHTTRRPSACANHRSGRPPGGAPLKPSRRSYKPALTGQFGEATRT